MWRQWIEFCTSLKLTMICLAAAMALIFAGTLAQVHLGIHEAQARYFQSFFVWWPPDAGGFQLPIFPGGHLIGAVLLVNLVAAHAKRFHWAWRKLGIHLTHAGLIIMLAGGLFTDLFAIESHMRLSNGETKNYSEDSRRAELAVIDLSHTDWDQVTAVPEAALRRHGVIDTSNLPFRIVVQSFYQNSRLSILRDREKGGQGVATQGVGARIAVQPTAPAIGVNEGNVTSAVIEIVARNSKHFSRNLAGLGCARRPSDFFLRRANVDDRNAPRALLQTLQCNSTEIHP